MFSKIRAANQPWPVYLEGEAAGLRMHGEYAMVKGLLACPNELISCWLRDFRAITQRCVSLKGDKVVSQLEGNKTSL